MQGRLLCPPATHSRNRLAHCKQMNHSKAFWAVRNQYADQMRLLWNRGYIGEGLWGRGALLGTGEWEKNTVQPGEVLPEHLCGGTYRSRGRKRKAKKTLTYQEQKERRILKKFGANGTPLGEDEEQKRILEKGRRVVAKPRVAGSARGRELRAAAALARFDQQKKEEPADDAEVKRGPADDDETASEAETESGSDYDDDALPDATEADGKKILDEKGRRMVKVCEDENPDDQDAQNELRELQSTQGPPGRSTTSSSNKAVDRTVIPKPRKQREAEDEIRHREEITQEDEKRPITQKPPEPRQQQPADSATAVQKLRDSGTRNCQVCSFANEEFSVTCWMCANVLDPSSVPNSWRCQSQSCAGSRYVNAGDCGVCGVCYARRPPS